VAAERLPVNENGDFYSAAMAKTAPTLLASGKQTKHTTER